MILQRHWPVIMVVGLLILPSCNADFSQIRAGSEDSAKSRDVFLGLDDPAPTYDAYFTWKDYDGTSSEEQALYIWCGKELGRGKEGLRKILDRLRALPKRSKVLVYPRYDMDWEEYGPSRFFPWLNYYAEFQQVVTDQELTMFYSPRDHRGAIHPACVAPQDIQGKRTGKRNRKRT